MNYIKEAALKFYEKNFVPVICRFLCKNKYLCSMTLLAIFYKGFWFLREFAEEEPFSYALFLQSYSLKLQKYRRKNYKDTLIPQRTFLLPVVL